MGASKAACLSYYYFYGLLTVFKTSFHSHPKWWWNSRRVLWWEQSSQSNSSRAVLIYTEWSVIVPAIGGQEKVKCELNPLWSLHSNCIKTCHHSKQWVELLSLQQTPAKWHLCCPGDTDPRLHAGRKKWQPRGVNTLNKRNKPIKAIEVEPLSLFWCSSVGSCRVFDFYLLFLTPRWSGLWLILSYSALSTHCENKLFPLNPLEFRWYHNLREKNSMYRSAHSFTL